MIIDYKLSPEYQPSDREVWLMSRKAEEDGHIVNTTIMRAFKNGDVKYYNGKYYKLCRHCFEYLEPTDFYGNNRYVLGVAYVCKKCTSARRKIKKYGVVAHATDAGMKNTKQTIVIKSKGGSEDEAT